MGKMTYKKRKNVKKQSFKNRKNKKIKGGGHDPVAPDAATGATTPVLATDAVVATDATTPVLATDAVVATDATTPVPATGATTDATTTDATTSVTEGVEEPQVGNPEDDVGYKQFLEDLKQNPDNILRKKAYLWGSVEEFFMYDTDTNKWENKRQTLLENDDVSSTQQTTNNLNESV